MHQLLLRVVIASTFFSPVKGDKLKCQDALLNWWHNLDAESRAQAEKEQGQHRHPWVSSSPSLSDQQCKEVIDWCSKLSHSQCVEAVALRSSVSSNDLQLENQKDLIAFHPTAHTTALSSASFEENEEEEEIDLDKLQISPQSRIWIDSAMSVALLAALVYLYGYISPMFSRVEDARRAKGFFGINYGVPQEAAAESTLSRAERFEALKGKLREDQIGRAKALHPRTTGYIDDGAACETPAKKRSGARGKSK